MSSIERIVYTVHAPHVPGGRISWIARYKNCREICGVGDTADEALRALKATEHALKVLGQPIRFKAL